MEMAKKIMPSSLAWLLGSLYKQCDDMGNAYVTMISLKKPKMQIISF